MLHFLGEELRLLRHFRVRSWFTSGFIDLGELGSSDVWPGVGFTLSLAEMPTHIAFLAFEHAVDCIVSTSVGHVVVLAWDDMRMDMRDALAGIDPVLQSDIE
jgi:hypothetical protein